MELHSSKPPHMAPSKFAAMMLAMCSLDASNVENITARVNDFETTGHGI